MTSFYPTTCCDSKTAKARDECWRCGQSACSDCATVILDSDGGSYRGFRLECRTCEGRMQEVRVLSLQDRLDLAQAQASGTLAEASEIPWIGDIEVQGLDRELGWIFFHELAQKARVELEHKREQLELAQWTIWAKNSKSRKRKGLLGLELGEEPF